MNVHEKEAKIHDALPFRERIQAFSGGEHGFSELGGSFMRFSRSAPLKPAVRLAMSVRVISSPSFLLPQVQSYFKVQRPLLSKGRTLFELALQSTDIICI